MTGPFPHRSGFVALLGLPNAGKSTLLNALLDFRLSIVSAKPQTTRHKILGILNGKNHQICFLDTPGLLGKAEDRLQRCLQWAARSAAREDADLILLLAEPAVPSEEDAAAFRGVAGAGKPMLVLLNKIDTVRDDAVLAAAEQAFAKILPGVETLRVSARERKGLKELSAAILRRLPESPAYYEKDRLSDRWERFFASELIREAIFSLYHQEVPHACAVLIEEFKEKPGKKDSISATIVVERPTQKAILLGKQGRKIRELRDASLAAIEAFLGRKAELKLWIKVSPHWRDDPQALKELGY